MMKFRLVSVAALVIFSMSICIAEDQRLYGAWKPVLYTVQGVSYPMDGLIIITPNYFSANTLFSLSGNINSDANANAGPYKVVNNKIIVTQWMQLHWRSGDPDENFLSRGDVEEIPYKIENGSLIFEFPSGNKYISERLSDEGATH